MEIIYPTGSDASNINVTSQKRLLRVVQGQTQATPTSGYLDPSLRNTSGGIQIPGIVNGGETPAGYAAAAPFSRTVAAFTYEGSLTPGLCLVKTSGENYAIASGIEGEKVAGLLGQWVGGSFDGVKNTNNISAWQGPDSYYDLLAPGFNPAEVANIATENPKGKVVYLYGGTDGRLTLKATGTASNDFPVAEVVEYNPSVLRFKLVI